MPSTAADHTAASSTLLPTTFSPSAYNQQPPHRPPRFAQQMRPKDTCSIFLLGGNYYPGKDKKRRQLKRKTLWYRVFCSSPWRKALSLLAFVYLVWFRALQPLASHLGDYRRIVFPRQRRNGLHWTWLLFDESLLDKIGSVEEERAEALRLVDERQRLQFGSEQRHAARLKALERIVPGWYHRNDENAEQNKVVEEKLREAERIMEEREAHRKGDDERHRHGEGNKMADKEKRSELSKEQKPSTPTRTLHNMDLFHDKSSCPSEMDPTDLRVTLVVQATADRLWILQRTCQRWTDPITLVLFLDSEEQRIEADATIAQNGECPQLTVVRHIMDRTLEENGKALYPVNRLRNLGLDSVQTSHVITADIDFVPSEGLAAKIRAVITTRNAARLQQATENSLPPEEKEAIVVPAFERISPMELCSGPDCEPDAVKILSNLALPASFEELRSCVKGRKECRVFQSHNNWDGHSSTRSAAWLDRKWYNEDELIPGPPTVNAGDASIDLTRIRTLQCFDSVRYEPYVVLRWCSPSRKTSGPVAPYYDERFHGYGKNKIELISHLRVRGYTFSILPEGFIIHAPHSISNAKIAWESTEESHLHADMDQLYPKFLKELVEKYKNKKHKIIKQC